MSKMSELSIELQENPNRTISSVLVNDDNLETKNPTHPSESWKNYWALCLNVVNAAGDVAAKDKLLMTSRDKSKAFNVKVVIDKYYDGDINKIKTARADAIATFWQTVDNVNWYARNNSLDQVSAMTLMGLLENEKNREKFRRHIKRHIESGHPPFELDDLPRRDFRKTTKSC